MASFLLLPRRRETPELLDNPAAVLQDLPSNLRDIRLLNRWFGGTSLALRAIEEVLPRNPSRLLDVATGSADIPLAVWRRGEERGVTLNITACDVSPEVLAEARRVVGSAPITLVEADARSLPWQDDTFEVVTCCLALHHFVPDDAVAVLREMWRVARECVIVTDLTRGYAAYAGTWLVTHLVARNRLTRHDGPLSVLRAHTPGEMRQLASAAGIQRVVVRRHPLFRQVLIARKGTRER